MRMRNHAWPDPREARQFPIKPLKHKEKGDALTDPTCLLFTTVKDSFSEGSIHAAHVAALGDASALAGAAAHIIELGATHHALADDGDRIDVRRIKREDALHALAEADLAHGEVAAHALVRAGDADAFVILTAAAVAFDDLHADAQRVAGAGFRDVHLGRAAGRETVWQTGYIS